MKGLPEQQPAMGFLRAPVAEVVRQKEPLVSPLEAEAPGVPEPRVVEAVEALHRAESLPVVVLPCRWKVFLPLPYPALYRLC